MIDRILSEVIDAVTSAHNEMYSAPERWNETIAGVPAKVTGHKSGGIRFIEGDGKNRHERRHNAVLLRNIRK